MKRLLLPLLVLGLSAFLSVSLHAQIVLDEPVVEFGSYIKFTGTNATNNYRFILDTYEWPDTRGPQFQLTIERLDSSKPAAFTTGDLADTNYWEAAFRTYTAQLAGEAMEASENVKRLTVDNVALLPDQFQGYGDALHDIYIISDGDYSIPDGCFSKGSGSKYNTDKLDCQIGGSLTLGNNVVDFNSGNLNIYTYDQTVARTWYEYKSSNSAAYNIYLNSDLYDGAVAPEQLGITGVMASVTINGSELTIPVPDTGGSIYPTDYGVITELVLNDFLATTTGDVTELFMEYAIVPDGYDWSVRPEWKQVYAELKEENVWGVEDADIDILEGLDNFSAYTIALSWNTNAADNKSERAHYPTDGQIIHLKFKTGDISTGIDEIPADEKGGKAPGFDLLGRRVKAAEKGIVVLDGKKVIRK